MGQWIVWDSVRCASRHLILKPDQGKKLNEGESMSEQWQQRVTVGQVAWRTKRRCNTGDRETEQKKGRRRGRPGTFAYMVTDYGGTKGPRALGPLFLEDASLVPSSLLPVSCPDSFAYPAASS
jgi:hypothetical protein